MKENNQPNIYFFFGPDTYRSLDKLREWRSAFVKKYGKGSVREPVVEGEINFLSLLSESSLFDPTILIIVRDPFSADSDVDGANQNSFLDLVARGTTAKRHLLVWQRGLLDKRTVFSRKIRELDKKGSIKIYEFENLNEEEGLKFIAQSLKTRGLSIKRDAAELLYQYVSKDRCLDSGRAMASILQLSAYCLGRDVIAKEDIFKLIPPNREEDAFLPMLSAFSKQDRVTFVSSLSSLARNSTAESELLGVISALFEQVKNMLVVLRLSESHDPEFIDEALDFKPGRSHYVLKDARGWGIDNLESILNKLIDLEYRVKQGKTLLTPELVNLLVHTQSK